jgi:transposase
MLIVGCDYHPSVQQIAWIDTESGECGESRLLHSNGEAERFYRTLKEQGANVRVGIEATGHARWFERLLAELEYELWVGDPAQIKAKRVRKQKNDRQDAQRLLKLMMEDRFPRVWVPSVENRDLRQLLWHRHRLVQMRTRVMNQLQAVALNEGVRRKKALWSQAGRSPLESFRLGPWATRRRQDLLQLLDQLNSSIAPLTAAVEQQAAQHADAQRLMTHPGVGAPTALAYVLIIGSPQRFRCGKQIRQLLGTDPLRRLKRQPAATGTHQQTRQRAVAFSAGRSGASRCPCQYRLATRVPAPGNAPRTSDRQGSDGPQTRSPLVLDVAQGMGLRTVFAIRFARGAARSRLWCEVDHRDTDWDALLPYPREFEEVVMVEIVIG